MKAREYLGELYYAEYRDGGYYVVNEGRTVGMPEIQLKPFIMGQFLIFVNRIQTLVNVPPYGRA